MSDKKVFMGLDIETTGSGSPADYALIQIGVAHRARVR